MFYEVDLVVPAGSTEENPAEVEVKLTKGVITRMECDFRYGPNFLVFAYIRSALHQHWPLNPDGKIASDGRAVASNEYIEVLYEPHTVICGATSPDCDYDHTLRFRIEVTLLEVAERGVHLESWIAKIMKLLGVSGS